MHSSVGKAVLSAANRKALRRRGNAVYLRGNGVSRVPRPQSNTSFPAATQRKILPPAWVMLWFCCQEQEVTRRRPFGPWLSHLWRHGNERSAINKLDFWELANHRSTESVGRFIKSDSAAIKMLSGVFLETFSSLNSFICFYCIKCTQDIHAETVMETDETWLCKNQTWLCSFCSEIIVLFVENAIPAVKMASFNQWYRRKFRGSEVLRWAMGAAVWQHFDFSSEWRGERAPGHANVSHESRSECMYL